MVVLSVVAFFLPGWFNHDVPRRDSTVKVASGERSAGGRLFRLLQSGHETGH